MEGKLTKTGLIFLDIKFAAAVSPYESKAACMDGDPKPMLISFHTSVHCLVI